MNQWIYTTLKYIQIQEYLTSTLTKQNSSVGQQLATPGKKKKSYHKNVSPKFFKKRSYESHPRL